MPDPACPTGQMASLMLMAACSPVAPTCRALRAWRALTCCTLAGCIGGKSTRTFSAALFKPWPTTRTPPRFTRMARTYLLPAGGLNWRQINPDIFGSMIQAVADDEERGALGMHYTSVPNILKVLNPLFLDDLRAQLAEAGENERKLLNLRKRMARIRVFDPACGSG